MEGLRQSKFYIYLQLFVSVVIAELGDRSMIATVALASKYSMVVLIIGGALGHVVATGLATVAGEFIGLRCPPKCVAITSGLIFIAFAVYDFVFDIQPML